MGSDSDGSNPTKVREVFSRYFNADHAPHAGDEAASVDDIVAKLWHFLQLIVDKSHEQGHVKRSSSTIFDEVKSENQRNHDNFTWLELQVKIVR